MDVATGFSQNDQLLSGLVPYLFGMAVLGPLLAVLLAGIFGVSLLM